MHNFIIFSIFFFNSKPCQLIFDLSVSFFYLYLLPIFLFWSQALWEDLSLAQKLERGETSARTKINSKGELLPRKKVLRFSKSFFLLELTLKTMTSGQLNHPLLPPPKSENVRGTNKRFWKCFGVNKNTQSESQGHWGSMGGRGQRGQGPAVINDALLCLGSLKREEWHPIRAH